MEQQLILIFVLVFSILLYLIILKSSFMKTCLDKSKILYKSMDKLKIIETFSNYSKNNNINTKQIELFVSFSVTPDTIEHLNYSITSILDQTLQPDKIIISIPKSFIEYPNKTVNYNKIITNELIELIDTKDDYGSSNKILGAIDRVHEIKDDGKISFLIILDEKMIYKPYMINKLFNQIKQNTKNSYSFDTEYINNEITIGKCDSCFATNIDNLVNITNFYYNLLGSEEKSLIDDENQWLSYFLKTKQSKIVNIKNKLHKEDDSISEISIE